MHRAYDQRRAHLYGGRRSVVVSDARPDEALCIVFLAQPSTMKSSACTAVNRIPA